MRKAKILAIGAIFCAFAMFGLTACDGGQPAEPAGGSSGSDVVEPAGPTSLAEVLEANEANSPDNYTLDGAISMVVGAEAAGESLEMPISIAFEDFDFAGDLGHGTMRMKMEYDGESEELAGELYFDLSGSTPVIYASEDGTNWFKSEGSSDDVQSFIPKFAIELDEDLLDAGVFTKTDKGYTVSVDMAKWMDKSGIGGVFSEITEATAGIIDGDEFEEAMEGVAVTYTFDTDCNLTGITMNDFAYEATMDLGSDTAKISITMNMDFDFTNYGKVAKSSVMVPADVVAAAE